MEKGGLDCREGWCVRTVDAIPMILGKLGLKVLEGEQDEAMADRERVVWVGLDGEKRGEREAEGGDEG